MNITRKSNVRVVWDVSPFDYSKDKEKDIISKFSKKYNLPKKNVHVETKLVQYDDSGNKLEFNGSIITDIQNPLFQQKLFEEYVECNKIENVDMEQISLIDAEINHLIDYDVYDKFRKYSIKWIEWDNFLSYGNGNRFDFTGLNGLVLLNGEPGNQSGKTTFALELLRFLLFGVTKKAKTLDKLFNKYLPKEEKVIVRACINTTGEDYVIERIIKRPKKRSSVSKATQEIKYYKMVNGYYNPDQPLEDYDPSDIKNEGDEVTKTNKIIKETIGKETDFDLIICATSENLSKLIDLTDGEKGRLLNRWIGLLPLEEKDKLAREKFNKQINPTLLCNKYNIETLQEEIVLNRVEIEKLNIQNKENNNKLIISNKEVAKLTTEKENLLSTKREINEVLLKLDIQTVESNKTELINQGKLLREKETFLKEEINKIKDIVFNKDELTQQRNDLTKIIERLAELRVEIINLKKQNESLKNDEFCPTCKRKYDNIDNTKQITENQKLITSLTDEGVKKNEIKSKIEENIKVLEEKSDNVNKKSKLELNLASIEVELEKTTSKYKEIVQLLKDYQQNKDDIDKNNILDISINNISVKLKVENGYNIELIKSIEQINVKINNYEEDIRNKEILINKLFIEQKLLKSWKIYLEMVSKDGISKMILRKSLPIINLQIGQLINDIVDFRVEIIINDKNDANFVIITEDEEGNEIMSDLIGASGLEKTVAALALRTVLSNISTLPKPNFILLDEILSAVAEENLPNIKILYDKIIKNYQFIFHISHLNVCKEWSEQCITIVKENKISKLKTNF